MLKILKTGMGILSIVSFLSAAESGAHWSYSGKSGPEHWGNLSADYAMCKLGRNQSPIDIPVYDIYDVDLAPIVFSYHAKSTHVSNGHSVKVEVDPGNFIVVDGEKFRLTQFHFHSPSETRIAGRSFPLEAHFVHVSDNGDIAVIAVLFEEGSSNALLKKIFHRAPAVANIQTPLILSPEEIKSLIPSRNGYIRFNGSLTTPPCSEGVRWLVMKQPLTLSKETLKRFRELVPHPNNRPVQPLNARVILK